MRLRLIPIVVAVGVLAVAAMMVDSPRQVAATPNQVAPTATPVAVWRYYSTSVRSVLQLVQRGTGQGLRVDVAIAGTGTPVPGVVDVDNNGRLNAYRGANVGGSGILYLSASTPVAVVNSTPLALTSSNVVISAAGTATIPLTIPAANYYGCIRNTGSPVVTIADTGNQILTAAAALGQYDSLCLVSDGTRAIEVSRADN
jgi:hypothetical protein